MLERAQILLPASVDASPFCRVFMVSVWEPKQAYLTVRARRSVTVFLQDLEAQLSIENGFTVRHPGLRRRRAELLFLVLASTGIYCMYCNESKHSIKG
jgi:hypothetical protein